MENNVDNLIILCRTHVNASVGIMSQLDLILQDNNKKSIERKIKSGKINRVHDQVSMNH